MERILGFIVFISLFIFGIYFFDKGKLGAWPFITFIGVILVGGLAFYGFDRLKELDMKNLRIVLSDIKETKEDIMKEANMLLESLADSNISSAVETGRWVANDFEYKMIEKREKAKDLLKKAGWSDKEIKDKTDQVSLFILGDIADQIKPKANEELKGKKAEDGQLLLVKFYEEFPDLRRKGKLTRESIEEVKKYLRKYGISELGFEQIFEDMEYFIKTGQLRRPIRN